MAAGLQPVAKLSLGALLLGTSAVLGPSLFAEEGWRLTRTPHFVVRHQARTLPKGLPLSLEKIHSHLKMDLAAFAPWMSKERVNLYLYANRESYLAGEFDPPGWSNGITFYDRRIVAVYDQSDNRSKLLEVTAHEMAHLFFEGYFGEKGLKPPQWLNEGLAMLEESRDRREAASSLWYQASRNLLDRGVLPMQDFLEVQPRPGDKNREAVSLWYVQAYSAVYYLCRVKSRVQFQLFAAKLREGRSVEQALRSAYGFPSLSRFEREWKKWLAELRSG